MLRELHVINFALIRDASIPFTEGLNVLSGETGAGKSLLVGAFNLLLGKRSSMDLISEGCAEAVVEGLFEISDARIQQLLADGIDSTELTADWLVRRVISRSGRNRISLNGRLITVATLKELASHLVEIQSQREHQSLLKASVQMDILDRFGGLLDLRQHFGELFNELRQEIESYEEAKAQSLSLREKYDFLKFQLHELEEAQLEVGLMQRLSQEHNLLNNQEEISQCLAESTYQLDETDNSILDQLGRMQAAITKFADMGESYKEMDSQLATTVELLTDLAYQMRAAADSLEWDEAKLEALRQRLDGLHRLEEKYHRKYDELLDYQAQLQADFDTIEHSADHLQDLAISIEKKSKKLRVLGDKLNKRRCKSAKALASAVAGQLQDLSMQSAQMEISVTARDYDESNPLAGYSSTGGDTVEYRVSTNPGEAFKALTRVASGGELSRILIGMQSVLAELVDLPVLVFDEIDANIGSRLGQVIATKLRTMAGGYQVLCITHLPQIASAAHQHLKVEKLVADGKTYTSIKVVDGEQRLEEIADMIHGANKDKVTMQQAKIMITQAQENS